MKLKSSSRRKRNNSKSILRLPGLEHAKAAVSNRLNPADAERGSQFLGFSTSHLHFTPTFLRLFQRPDHLRFRVPALRHSSSPFFVRKNTRTCWERWGADQ